MSLKHRLSPSSLPPSKRVHTLSTSTTISKPVVTFDSALFDELILFVFSHLSWVDLCSAQYVNRNWSRLAADNQLWKSLYLKEYGRSRLRGAKGFIGRSDGREIKPLPGRAKGEDLDIRDWKWMFRISSNWRTGRCTVEHLERPRDLSPSLNQDSEYPEQTHILLAGSLTITASSRPSMAPRIYLRTPACPEHVVHCGSTRHNVTTQITALALDQSPPSSGSNLRLAAFLSTGEFAIFTLGHGPPLTSSRKLVYVPMSRSHRTSPIIQAVYHHPLLITLSKAFHLSVYDISHNTVTHTQTLTSFTSFPPSSLVLSTPSSTTYKLVLAYTVPVYPAHWSVGATELIIAGAKSSPSHSSSPSTSSVFASPPPSSMSIISTRTIRALDVPQGWIDQKKLHTMREQWSRKVSRVADTQTDGKWVVLAPADAFPTPTTSLSPYDSDSSSSPSSPLSLSSSPPPVHSSPGLHSPTSLQLYRLSLPSSSQYQHQQAWASSSSTAPPKLTFVRTLHGQIGPVSALALADGRCVSLGLNGSVWVWDLEGGTGAQVAGASNSFPKDFQGTHQKGTIAFDERRIITVGADGLVVRRFDV